MFVGLSLLLAFQAMNSVEAGNEPVPSRPEQAQARPSASRCHTLANLPQRLRALHRAELNDCAALREPATARRMPG